MIGPVPTSIPQFILLGNWLLEMDFQKKWQRIKSNRLFWLLASVFFIHALGLFYSNNLRDGWNDGQIKIPMFILPLIFFSTKPLSRPELKGVLFCFLFGCFANTAWCLVYSFVIHHNQIGRDASRFMSHIRLGLYLNMAIACCIYFFVKMQGTFKKLFFFSLTLYFVSTMYALGLASGLVNFFILSGIGVAIILYHQKPLMMIGSLLLLTIALAFVANNIFEITSSQLKVNNTQNNLQAKKSLSGRSYVHFDKKGQRENGNYVFVNIQLEELKKEWQLLFPADSFNFNPHPVNLNRYEVLIRYLASKGLNKDSVGVSKLTDEDKNNIQMNICNYHYTSWGYMHKRIYELVCEYDDFINGRDVNGNSLTMRFYFWDAAQQVIRQHPILGVGTGDVQDELNKIYLKSHSPLEKEWYKRPHNQFLTICVALGVCGLAIFLIALFYPLIVLRKHLFVLYWPFFILLIVSFMFEDTLETQAGVTFYVFFNTLLVSSAWFDKYGLNNKMEERAVE
jgi:hypothetical protein